MSEWLAQPLGSLAAFQKGRKVETSEHPREGFAPYLGASAISGVVEEYGDMRAGVIAASGDVLMLWDGERSGLVGKAQAGVISSTVARLSPKTDVEGEYLYYALDFKFEWIQGRRTGTGVPHVPKDLARILSISYPKSKSEQRRIAEILSTLDEAIEQTEALIAKHQQIKAGLMHDLFTRGVTPDGHLRPTRDQAPDLYKESPLGWIPKEWEVKSLVELYSSPIRDFGSFSSTNLISFLDEGVPFIKSEMIEAGSIAWCTVMYISEEVHRFLSKSHVHKGNILFSKIGSALGKAVVYDGSWGVCNSNAAIAKIDIDDRKAGTFFVTYFLNHNIAQTQFKNMIVSLLPRINLGDINRLLVPVPRLLEQKVIEARLVAADSVLMSEHQQLNKMKSLKRGLMHDLLTGRMYVSPARAKEVSTMAQAPSDLEPNT